MKRGLFILFFILVFSSMAVGKTFYMSFYQSTVRQYQSVINKELGRLYDRNEDQRDNAFDQMKKIVEQQLQKGDQFFVYQVLTGFVNGRLAPADLMGNEDYREDINDLQDDVLDYLVDESSNSDRSVSAREFLMNQLSTIAVNNRLYEFSQNSKTISALGNGADSDVFVIRHAAMVGLKGVALKTGEKWEDAAEDAAEYMVDLLDSNSEEVKRMAFIECLNALEKAQTRTAATKLLWEKTTDALSDIVSPKLKKSVHDKFGSLVSSKSGSMFENQVKEAREKLEEMSFQTSVVKDPINEVLANLESESDLDELEPMLNTLYSEAKKDRAVFYAVYSRVIREALNNENSQYKIRLLNDLVISMTHDTQSTLFFNHATSLLLQELFYFQNSQKATVPLAMLGSLLSSTDYEQLLIPAISELSKISETELPIWVQRRVIGILFIQAGDSPNVKVAMEATKSLVNIAKTSKLSVLRWEASKRLEHLTKFAKDNLVKKHAANWK